MAITVTILIISLMLYPILSPRIFQLGDLIEIWFSFGVAQRAGVLTRAPVLHRRSGNLRT